MQYDDFDLCIKKKVDGHYPIKAKSRTMGEAEGVLSLDLNAQEVVETRETLTAGRTDSNVLMRFGGSLCDRLFQDQIRDLLRTSLGQVLKEDEKGVRIRCANASATFLAGVNRSSPYKIIEWLQSSSSTVAQELWYSD